MCKQRERERERERANGGEGGVGSDHLAPYTILNIKEIRTITRRRQSLRPGAPGAQNKKGSNTLTNSDHISGSEHPISRTRDTRATDREGLNTQSDAHVTPGRQTEQV